MSVLATQLGEAVERERVFMERVREVAFECLRTDDMGQLVNMIVIGQARAGVVDGLVDALRLCDGRDVDGFVQGVSELLGDGTVEVVDDSSGGVGAVLSDRLFECRCRGYRTGLREALHIATGRTPNEVLER